MAPQSPPGPAGPRWGPRWRLGPWWGHGRHDTAVSHSPPDWCQRWMEPMWFLWHLHCVGTKLNQVQWCQVSQLSLEHKMNKENTIKWEKVDNSVGWVEHNEANFHFILLCIVADSRYFGLSGKTCLVYNNLKTTAFNVGEQVSWLIETVDGFINEIFSHALCFFLLLFFFPRRMSDRKKIPKAVKLALFSASSILESDSYKSGRVVPHICSNEWLCRLKRLNIG